ncbi:YSIRK-type signal peptide-containing protein [Lactobacillus crispatus]|uniref:YSIRK-type signal peptide-containing protein n=1 Tax=Lactobacillus crispatus TaxID=47770 RepID=A0AAW8WMI8_9LACO|nr:YSIRK-type signal peptide-containing protein [Lactobacillus crispatus]MBW0438086.1 YSIRK-type signal peptide-containing protein [Lactobacillus crispatus]MBW0443604.1 YSIRK-type signal peptide-containing protein [Lactobacillus crispatus]MBW0456794.1 YSIRK-type signal peptide-containing protein [Lactobacillus crispatus]MDK6665743.1 YSIRK-type signal peptide-containing protein [Lactobacillus crispatus]MDK8612320.1 YSIRK-type signal peptide-containing protein [Lactobacillus crispatus]
MKNKLQQNADQGQHFGIRKLSIGVTSVLLSTLFYVGAINTNTVQASTVDSGVQTAKVVQKKADSSVQAGLNKDKTDDVSGKAAEPTSQENDNTADNIIQKII